jgi:CheY-like chemotaxis protein
MKNILVVDDDQFIRSTVKNMLEFLGYEVAEACDGIEGLKMFLKSPTDLVLTDLQMPLMDGGSLAHLIKGKSPLTPVVLVTGSDSKEIKERLKDKTIDAIIYKPFKLEGLFKTIEILCAENYEKPLEEQMAAN